MSDVADRYLRLAEQFGARVSAAPADGWDNLSPCEGWTARDVVRHVVETQRHLVARVNGDEAEPDPLPDGFDPRAAWEASLRDVRDALSQPGALEKTVPGPMGDMPIEFAVGRIYASDVLIHTWDLARAVGGDERLDADAVAQAHKGFEPMDAMIRRPGVFGPKIDPPDDADEQTRFLCFVGRRP